MLYYYEKDLWINFFKKLGFQIVISDSSNKEILDNGNNIAPSESCLSLKLYLGHIINLKKMWLYTYTKNILHKEKWTSMHKF